MRPDLIVVAGVGLEDATQVRLAEHHNLVKALATDRADKPLDVSILPRRTSRDWVIPDAHRTNTTAVRVPERSVAVAEQMTRCLVPGKGFGHLACDPFCGRISGHGDPCQPPSRVAKNHLAIQQSEGDGSYHEQVDRCDPAGLILQERLPTLRTRSPDSDHVASNGRFADVDSEHQQFAVDPRRTPQRIFAAHPADQRSNFTIDPGSTATLPRLPAPVGAEPASMPAEHGLWLDYDHGVQHRREEPAQADQNQPIDVT